MKVHLYASLPHYLKHMEPIWRELPDELRGDLVYDASRGGYWPPNQHDVVLVAGWQDVRMMQNRARLIYVEHGAGQAYLGDPLVADTPGYSGHGGHKHRNVVGYICPSQTVADRWETAPAIAVGCPKMDRWYRVEEMHQPSRTVCFAWHWDSELCPETRTAFPHYEADMPLIVARWKDLGWTVYGHAHPRWGRPFVELLERCGMTILPRDDDVFAKAHVLVLDNSSIGYEFASLGRPTIWLNAPWYRRDVEHGLRFWSHVPGLQLGDPGALLDEMVIEGTLHPAASRLPGWWRGVYEHADGTSSQRAAQWVTELVGSL